MVIILWIVQMKTGKGQTGIFINIYMMKIHLKQNGILHIVLIAVEKLSFTKWMYHD